jgi:hypothetical protein
MATFTNFFKIVTPQQRARDYTLATDSMNLNHADGGAVANISWYTQIMKGAGSRMQRYSQYDGMDMDIDIYRALDIIAEEASNDDPTTNLPFLIEYQNEDSEDVSDTIITTLRAALRQWSRIQDLNNRIYRITRCVIKYGDCFFKKTKDTNRWEYVDPSKVMGIEIDDKGEKIAYHLRGTGSNSIFGAKSTHIDIISREAIVHYTLSDDMGTSAPFGESLLEPIFRTFKQLSAMEDAVVIYRLTRAPERRVYYIDVGNMPAQRVKQYLESVKNELRQKRMPNTSTQGAEVVDGTYNPNCLDMNTRVPLLDGRTLSLYELTEEFKQGKVNWVYSCNPETGEVVPGVISWSGITKKNTEVIKLKLDNGSEIICTPDHKFPIYGKGFVQAQHLTLNDSFIPFHVQDKVMYKNSDYQQVFNNSTQTWEWTHQIVAKFIKQHEQHTEFTYSDEYKDKEKNIIHHVDYNRKNNNPNNLVFMDREDHNLFHRETKAEWWANLSEETRHQVVSSIAEGTKIAMGNIPKELREVQVEKQLERIRAYHYANKLNPTIQYTKWQQDSVERVKQWSRDPVILAARSAFAKEHGYKNLPTNQELQVSQEMFSRAVKLICEKNLSKAATLEVLSSDIEFMRYYREANEKQIGKHFKINLNKISEKMLLKFYKFINVSGWKQFKSHLFLYNHKIIEIELVDNMDVGCITIDQNETFHNFHTFAIEGGVFVKNSISEDIFLAQTSNGRGSRVETLPGGENLGELTELKYFRNKMREGLRVPQSYLNPADGQSAQFNDGKVGVAYIEELRFANYVRRVQNKIEKVMDFEFKCYLENIGLSIDENLFILRLPEPQNFSLYRQAALDADLINAYKSISDEKLLSARFKLKRYLGLTEDELSMNELMLKQELGIDENANIDAIRQIYDPIQMEARKAVAVKPKIEEKKASGGDSSGGDEMGGGDDSGLPDMGGGDELGGGDDSGLPDLGNL